MQERPPEVRGTLCGLVVIRREKDAPAMADVFLPADDYQCPGSPAWIHHASCKMEVKLEAWIHHASCKMEAWIHHASCKNDPQKCEGGYVRADDHSTRTPDAPHRAVW